MIIKAKALRNSLKLFLVLSCFILDFRFHYRNLTAARLHNLQLPATSKNKYEKLQERSKKTRQPRIVFQFKAFFDQSRAIMLGVKVEKNYIATQNRTSAA